MKHLKFQTILEPTPLLYLEGRVGEVNHSVREWVDSKKGDLEKNSDAERLLEAKQYALSQIPTLAGRTMDDIAKHFWRVGVVDKERSIKNLEGSVRKRVLDTLKDAPAASPTMPRWGGNYLRVIQDIEKDEDDAILTLQDTDRALKSITQLKTKYERQAKILIDRKNELDKTRKNFANLLRVTNNYVVPSWLVGRSEYTRKDNTSEHFRFSKGNEVALRVFNELEQKIQAKKERASESFKDNKSHVEESFNSLSPERKEDFMAFVESETQGTNVLDSAPDWAKQVVFGLDFQQRLEVFSALNLDPRDSLEALSKNEAVFNAVESELNQRRTILDGKVKTITTDNLKELRKSLKGFKAEAGFDPSNQNSLQTFVNEIETYLDREGDVSITTYLAGYPNGETLNTTEKLVAYLRALIDNKDTLVEAKMAKPLKAKLLTYLNFLENIDAQDAVEGQTDDFLTHRNVIKKRLEAGKALIDSTLKDVHSVHDISAGSIIEINTFVGQAKRELKGYESFLNGANKLSETEKSLLASLYNKVSDLIAQFEALKNTWKQESQNHQEALKEAQKEEAEAKEEKDRAKAAYDKAEKDYRAATKKLGIQRSAANNAKKRLTTAEKNKKRLEKRYTDLAPKHNKGTLSDTEETEFAKLTFDLEAANETYSDAKADIDKETSAVEESQPRVTELENLVRTTEEAYINAQNKHNEAKAKKTALTATPTGTSLDFDFTSAEQHFGELLATIDEEIKDLKAFKKAGNTGSNSEQIQRYLLEQSALNNNEQHKSRLQKIQNDTFTSLQKMPQGVFLSRINFVQYMHGRKITSDTALTSPKSEINNLTILDQTKDAIILYTNGGSQLVVIQKSNDGKVEVLSFAAPSSFDPGKNIPLSYIPEKADQIGELTTINA